MPDLRGGMTIEDETLAVTINSRRSASASTSRRARVVALSLAPVFFGLCAVFIGQDTNWDLRNYHLYNAWAFVNRRLDVDLAAAGLASFFNPLLDLPYFAMTQSLSPRVVAFAMGCWHGLSFVILWKIVRDALGRDANTFVVLLLTATGCCSSMFLSELGNTMGDDGTAPLMLASVAIVLTSRRRAESSSSQNMTTLMIAGAVAGLGIGLKLTNAPYGVGLLAGVFALGGSLRLRMKHMVIVASGLLLGTLVTGGFWFGTMWQHYGNPLFPQFNHLFGAPLAASMSIDDRWLPRGLVEALLFPYDFTLFPMRIGELPIFQLLWPAAYTLLLMVAARHVFATRLPASSVAPSSPAAIDGFLLAYVVTGFCLWMLIFSVERYLVVLELLLPLATWLLLHHLSGRATTQRIGVTLMLAACALSIAHFETWGNARFADTTYAVDSPAIADPGHATVIVLTAPVAWMFTQWPRELAYVSLNSTMPESSAYHARARDIVVRRGGPMYALVASAKVDENSGMARLNRWLTAHDVNEKDFVCRLARLNFSHAPSTDIVFEDRIASNDVDRPCRFRRDSAKYGAALGDDRALANRAADSIAALGYEIDVARCGRFTSSIGDKTFANQLCPVQMR